MELQALPLMSWATLGQSQCSGPISSSLTDGSGQVVPAALSSTALLQFPGVAKDHVRFSPHGLQQNQNGSLLPTSHLLQDM